MDLNLIVYKDKSQDSKELITEKIMKAIKLGYEVIALSCSIGPDEILQVPLPVKATLDPVPDKIRILTRLTCSVDDTLQTHKLLQSDAAKKYDILAINPLNDKMLGHICNGQLDCDIITFDMTTRLPVNLRRANLTVPINKGTCFEINYNDALIDSSCRQNLFSHSQVLVDKSKGRNVLVSSGCRVSMFLRAPYDIANLAILFGLKEHQSKEAVFKNGEKVIKHSGAIKLESELSLNEKWLINEFHLDKAKEPDAKKAKLK